MTSGRSRAWLDFYEQDRRTTTIDDPSLHQGRVRSNPHVQGIFPTFVQISWRPSAPAAEMLETVTQRASNTLLHPHAQVVNLVSSLGVFRPLHISLSQNLQLEAAQRDEFLYLLERSIKETQVTPFVIKFVGLKWYFDRDAAPPRHYLCLEPAGEYGPKLSSLLWAVNKVALNFDQGLLYYTPLLPFISMLRLENLPKLCCADKFHVSLAWTEGTPKTGVSVGEIVSRDGVIKIEDLELPVTHIKVTVGDAVREVALGSNAPSKPSMGGLRLF